MFANVGLGGRIKRLRLEKYQAVEGTLYVSTPFGRVITLDPATGTEHRNYDPRIDLDGG